MSSIQTILSSNTFGEWLVTINQVITENNSANSSVHPNILVRRDSQGSFSANTLTANSISLVNTVNSITTDFFTNSHSSLATSKAVYDLLTGGSSKRLDLNINSVEFPDGSIVKEIIENYSAPSTYDYDQPVTANAVIQMIEGRRNVSIPLEPVVNSLRFRLGGFVNQVEDDFSSINMAVDGSKTLVTAKAIENFLKTPTLDIHAKTLQIDNTQKVRRIATDFANIDDDTLATTKAINDYIGGVDNDIGTFEGTSLQIGTHTPVNKFTDDFTPIADTAVPTTLGVDFYLRGGLSQINANSVEANTTTSKDALVSNSIVLFGVAINAISTDLSVLNDSTLATTNAIVSFLSSGGAQSVSANTVTVSGFTINSIANIIDTANLNSNTLATTQGIYDLITGGSSSPSLPVSANTLTFPGTSGGVVVNSIADVLDAANSSANSLVTSEAVWDLLTNRTLNAKFNSLALFQGPAVNWIHQDAVVYNQTSLMTSEAIVNYVQDSFNSTTQTLQVGTVEAAQAMGSPKVETELITTSTYGDNVTIEVGGTELKVNALGVFINGAAIVTV